MKNLFSSDLETLYAFESDSLIISEFKRNDVDSSLPPNKRFFWLSYDKKNRTLKRLDFISMESTELLEHRLFSQGILKFSNTYANFRDHRGVINLIVSTQMPEHCQTAILNYFKEL